MITWPKMSYIEFCKFNHSEDTVLSKKQFDDYVRRYDAFNSYFLKQFGV